MTPQKLKEKYPFISKILLSTEISIPERAIDRVIGHDKQIKIIELALKNKRHLLLVGVPGVGKSLLVKAISEKFFDVSEEVYILKNEKTPYRPLIKKVSYTPQELEAIRLFHEGEEIDLDAVPIEVLYRLNFYCKACNLKSDSNLLKCSNCSKFKLQKNVSAEKNFYLEGIMNIVGGNLTQEKEQKNNAPIFLNLEENSEKLNLKAGIYQREGFKLLRYPLIMKKYLFNRQTKNQFLSLSIQRKNFVKLIGLGDAEVLGDIRHDPYGGDPRVGVEDHKRVIPGAIHEAHQGILYIDELAKVHPFIQRGLLTAMQDKVYSISNSGRNGAFVKVDDYPCDFVLVVSLNISDLKTVIKPLRSRIFGNGYELFFSSTMELNETNIQKFFQFIAQELNSQNLIPMTGEGMLALLSHAIVLGEKETKQNKQISLRLREIAGLIFKIADFASSKGKEFITEEEVKEVIALFPPIERVLEEKYGSFYDAKTFEENYSFE